VQILLKAGADIHARAADGQTAVQSATKKGWTKTVSFLTANGAP
jgi:ankyrin repeat protein